MQLHLIRHGQTNWNEERRIQGQSDSFLTELGISQAQALGARLSSTRYDAHYCSSSLRTRQTAEQAFPEAASVHYRDDLREIFLGPWEGNLYAEMAEREPLNYKHFWEEPHLFAVAGAESFHDLQRRAVAAIDEIYAAHKGQSVALVSHGALIKAYLCAVEGRPLAQFWEPPTMHNCCHSIVNFAADGTPSIIQYADEPLN
jgi:probable phosphoglycerate mutase